MSKGIVPSVPIAIGITVTVIVFFNSQARSKFLSLNSFSLIFFQRFAGSVFYSVGSLRIIYSFATVYSRVT